jgi:hypothetical protein
MPAPPRKTASAIAIARRSKQRSVIDLRRKTTSKRALRQNGITRIAASQPAQIALCHASNQTQVSILLTFVRGLWEDIRVNSDCLAWRAARETGLVGCRPIYLQHAIMIACSRDEVLVPSRFGFPETMADSNHCLRRAYSKS